MKNLDNQIRQVLKLDDKVKELAKSLFQHKSLLIMGRGYNFATCMEGALVSFFVFAIMIKKKFDESLLTCYFQIYLSESQRVDLHA